MILTKIVRATQPRSLLDECNRESGRLYTQTMVEHWRIYRNKGVWLSPGMDEKYNDFLSPTSLHAHSRDAAQQAFARAVKTTHAIHKVCGCPFPHKIKSGERPSEEHDPSTEGGILARARTAIRVLLRPTCKRSSRGSTPGLQPKKIHYEWHFVDRRWSCAVMRTTGASVAVDMGEVHPAAVTDGNTGLVTLRPEPRSTGRDCRRSPAGRQKGTDETWLQTIRRLAQAKAKARKKAAAGAAGHSAQSLPGGCDYAVETKAKEIVIGDVREIADGVHRGKKSNQKISSAAWKTPNMSPTSSAGDGNTARR
jgi:hypothetical protein